MPSVQPISFPQKRANAKNHLGTVKQLRSKFELNLQAIEGLNTDVIFQNKNKLTPMLEDLSKQTQEPETKTKFTTLQKKLIAELSTSYKGLELQQRQKDVKPTIIKWLRLINSSENAIGTQGLFEQTHEKLKTDTIIVTQESPNQEDPQSESMPKNNFYEELLTSDRLISVKGNHTEWSLSDKVDKYLKEKGIIRESPNGKDDAILILTALLANAPEDKKQQIKENLKTLSTNTANRISGNNPALLAQIQELEDENLEQKSIIEHQQVHIESIESDLETKEVESLQQKKILANHEKRIRELEEQLELVTQEKEALEEEAIDAQQSQILMNELNEKLKQAEEKNFELQWKNLSHENKEMHDFFEALIPQIASTEHPSYTEKMGLVDRYKDTYVSMKSHPATHGNPEKLKQIIKIWHQLSFTPIDGKPIDKTNADNFQKKLKDVALLIIKNKYPEDITEFSDRFNQKIDELFEKPKTTLDTFIKDLETMITKETNQLFLNKAIFVSGTLSEEQKLLLNPFTTIVEDLLLRDDIFSESEMSLEQKEEEITPSYTQALFVFELPDDQDASTSTLSNIVKQNKATIATKIEEQKTTINANILELLKNLVHSLDGKPNAIKLVDDTITKKIFTPEGKIKENFLTTLAPQEQQQLYERLLNLFTATSSKNALIYEGHQYANRTPIVDTLQKFIAANAELKNIIETSQSELKTLYEQQSIYNQQDDLIDQSLNKTMMALKSLQALLNSPPKVETMKLPSYERLSENLEKIKKVCSSSDTPQVLKDVESMLHNFLMLYKRNISKFSQEEINSPEKQADIKSLSDQTEYLMQVIDTILTKPTQLNRPELEATQLNYEEKDPLEFSTTMEGINSLDLLKTKTLDEPQQKMILEIETSFETLFTLKWPPHIEVLNTFILSQASDEKEKSSMSGVFADLYNGKFLDFLLEGTPNEEFFETKKDSFNTLISSIYADLNSSNPITVDDLKKVLVSEEYKAAYTKFDEDKDTYSTLPPKLNPITSEQLKTTLTPSTKSQLMFQQLIYSTEKGSKWTDKWRPELEKKPIVQNETLSGLFKLIHQKLKESNKDKIKYENFTIEKIEKDKTEYVKLSLNEEEIGFIKYNTLDSYVFKNEDFITPDKFNKQIEKFDQETFLTEHSKEVNETTFETNLNTALLDHYGIVEPGNRQDYERFLQNHKELTEQLETANLISAIRIDTEIKELEKDKKVPKGKEIAAIKNKILKKRPKNISQPAAPTVAGAVPTDESIKASLKEDQDVKTALGDTLDQIIGNEQIFEALKTDNDQLLGITLKQHLHDPRNPMKAPRAKKALKDAYKKYSKPTVAPTVAAAVPNDESIKATLKEDQAVKTALGDTLDQIIGNEQIFEALKTDNDQLLGITLKQHLHDPRNPMKAPRAKKALKDAYKKYSKPTVAPTVAAAVPTQPTELNTSLLKQALQNIGITNLDENTIFRAINEHNQKDAILKAFFNGEEVKGGLTPNPCCNAFIEIFGPQNITKFSSLTKAYKELTTAPPVAAAPPTDESIAEELNKHIETLQIPIPPEKAQQYKGLLDIKKEDLPTYIQTLETLQTDKTQWADLLLEAHKKSFNEASRLEAICMDALKGDSEGTHNNPKKITLDHFINIHMPDLEAPTRVYLKAFILTQDQTQADLLLEKLNPELKKVFRTLKTLATATDYNFTEPQWEMFIKFSEKFESLTEIFKDAEAQQNADNINNLESMLHALLIDEILGSTTYDTYYEKLPEKEKTKLMRFQSKNQPIIKGLLQSDEGSQLKAVYEVEKYSSTLSYLPLEGLHSLIPLMKQELDIPAILKDIKEKYIGVTKEDTKTWALQQIFDDKYFLIRLILDEEFETITNEEAIQKIKDKLTQGSIDMTTDTIESLYEACKKELKKEITTPSAEVASSTPFTELEEKKSEENTTNPLDISHIQTIIEEMMQTPDIESDTIDEFTLFLGTESNTQNELIKLINTHKDKVSTQIFELNIINILEKLKLKKEQKIQIKTALRKILEKVKLKEDTIQESKINQRDLIEKLKDHKTIIEDEKLRLGKIEQLTREIQTMDLETLEKFEQFKLAQLQSSAPQSLSKDLLGAIQHV